MDEVVTRISSEPLSVFHAESLISETLSHGFFSRRGGASTGLFEGLNCGLGSQDGPHPVAQNRSLVADHLDVEVDHLLGLYQIHSAQVVTVDGPWSASERPKADAMVTVTPGIALSIVTADCAPVLLADLGAGVIGAAHAGWQGALGGVIEATIEAMTDLGAQPGQISAAIGPCISQTHYQVGPEFRERFLQQAHTHGDFFLPSPDPQRPDHWQFDLTGFVAGRLKQAGLKALTKLNLCTYADPETFFSYRRSVHKGEADYGRNISAIALRQT